MPAIFYLTILFLLALAGIAVRVVRSRARHRRVLAVLARSMGLTYRSHDALQLARRYHRLTLMREGHDPRTWDLLTGPTAQGALTCFAYRYEVGFGINRAVRTWWVAVLETHRPWGRLALRYCRVHNGPAGTWESHCSTVAGPPPYDGGWTLVCRRGQLPDWFPASLVERLTALECDVHLELCDHLIALQVPMDDTQLQVKRLVQTLQETDRELLAAVDPEGPRPDRALLPGGHHA